MDMIKIMENSITDEEVLKVATMVEDSKNETDSLLDIIEKEYENYDNSNDPLEEGTSQYVNDGILMGDPDEDKKFEFDHFNNIDTDIEEIINKNLPENLGKNYNLSDEDTIKFASVITRIRAKEKFNVYSELPDELKQHIDAIVMEQDLSMVDKIKAKNAVAKMVLEDLIADAELDSISIDLEKAMKELIPGPVELYSEFNKDYIENDLIDIAEKLKEEHPKKAENLLGMRKGYIDAYTYEPLYELLNNGKIVKNIRRAEVLWSRTDCEYLRLAGICKFKLHPLETLRKSLINLGFNDIQAKRIITLFVYTYTNGVIDYNSENEYNDIYRNSFANYFEINIINLSLTNGGTSEFSKEIIENLTQLCNKIDTIIEQKEAELSNKKKKKKG